MWDGLQNITYNDMVTQINVLGVEISTETDNLCKINYDPVMEKAIGSNLE